MNEEDPRRTALETGIRTEYDYESGLVQITVISSIEYADVSLDVARAQLANIMSRIGQPPNQQPLEQRPKPRPRQGNVTSLRSNHEPTLPRVSQQRASTNYSGDPIDPYAYDTPDRF